jgi:hypothetical protein
MKPEKLGRMNFKR